MKKDFVGYVPGLIGVEDFIDFSNPPEKHSMLLGAFAEPINMPYQTAMRRAPDYDTMCLLVKNAIVDQQRINGTNGKIIASSVGAAVLRGVLPLLAAGNHPIPDVIMIGPVWSISETVQKMAGPHLQALLDGKIKKLDMPVTGINAGTFPLTRDLYLQALAAEAKPLPTVPSVTILTAETDQFCTPAQAQKISDTFSTTHGTHVVGWKGGHNENSLSRDDDILIALSRTLRMPNPLRMARNMWNRFDGSSKAHYQKRALLDRYKKILGNPTLDTSARATAKARLNIMQRMVINPALARPITK